MEKQSLMNEPLIILETERLRLKYMQMADVAALVDLWVDPDVTCHMGGPRDRNTVTANLMQTAKDPTADRYDLWPVEEKATGKVIGHCGVLDKEVDGKTEFELVYVLAKSVWGKGYASEIAAGIRDYSFGRMNLARLIALIEPENEASERVALKVGMRLEKEVLRPGGAVRRVYALKAPGL
jgi:[ribosomal protein S5]-alanine N-acetyltransferase